MREYLRRQNFKGSTYEMTMHSYACKKGLVGYGQDFRATQTEKGKSRPFGTLKRPLPLARPSAKREHSTPSRSILFGNAHEHDDGFGTLRHRRISWLHTCQHWSFPPEQPSHRVVIYRNYVLPPALGPQ